VTTPFDAPHAELAWTFIQSLSEADDVDEGFTLLSDDFTYWSLYTRVCIAVVVEAYATGTKPDGEQYETPYICILETRDGLIVSLREYSDTRLTTEVLGD
jgi:uncharacterized protein